jgi:hypothetical protein
MNVPLWLVLAVLGGAAILYALFWCIVALEKSARRTAEQSVKLEQAITTLAVALMQATATLERAREALAPAVEEIKTTMPGIPKLLEAVAKVGSAQLEMLAAQRATQSNPFGGKKNAVIQKDVEQANLEYEITNLMRSEGCSREEAMLRLNPANARSVWDSSNVFDGWQR